MGRLRFRGQDARIGWCAIACMVAGFGCSMPPDDAGVAIQVPNLQRADFFPHLPGVKGNQFGVAPQVLGDFDCLMVMATATDIAPNKNFMNSCAGTDGSGSYTPGPGMPAQAGILAGMIPITGGEIDLQIPAGTSRLFQVGAVQSGMTDSLDNVVCPDINLIPSMIAQGKSVPVTDPIEVGRATSDVLGDTTVPIQVSFDPMASQPIFTCDQNSYAGPLVSMTGLALWFDSTVWEVSGGVPQIDPSHLCPSYFSGEGPWTDSSPKGNTGSFVEAIDPLCWDSNTLALNFASSTTGTGYVSGVNVVGNSTLSPTASISMDAWINVAATPTSPLPIAQRFVKDVSGTYGPTNGFYGYELEVNASGKLELDVAEGTTNLAFPTCQIMSATAVTPGQWAHVAGTYDGSTALIYVNDVPAGTLSCAYSVATIGNALNGIGAPLEVGLDNSGNAGGYYAFYGMLGQVRYYNDHVLSPAEVRSNCMSNEPLYDHSMSTCQ